MPIKKSNNPFAGKTKSAVGKKKTKKKRVKKSKRVDHAVFGYQATPFDDGRLRLFSLPGNAFSLTQRIKSLIMHLTGIVVVYEK